MKRTTLTIALAAIAAFAVQDAGAWALFGSSVGNAAGRMKSADRLLEKADAAFEEGGAASASNGYARALEKYRAIDRDYPDFGDGLAQIRIAYCEERLAVCAMPDAPGVGGEPAGEPQDAPAPNAVSAAEAFNAASGETPAAPQQPAAEAAPEPQPEYNPRYFAYDFSEAGELVSKGRYADAIEILVPMVKFDPDNRQLRMLLAAARLGAGQADMAIATLEDLRGRREDLPLLLMISGAYASAGRHPDALLALDAAVRLAPGEPDPFYNLAWLTLLMDPGAPEARSTADGYYQQALKRGAARDPALEGAIRAD